MKNKEKLYLKELHSEDKNIWNDLNSVTEMFKEKVNENDIEEDNDSTSKNKMIKIEDAMADVLDGKWKNEMNTIDKISQIGKGL